MVGTTRQQISKLVKGERRVTYEWAQRLAPPLGANWRELMEDLPPPREDGSITQDMILLGIGKRLAWARIYRSISLPEAATRFGVPSERLMDLEAGQAAPTVFELATMAAKLKFSLDYLVLGRIEALPYGVAEALPKEAQPSELE